MIGGITATGLTMGNPEVRPMDIHTVLGVSKRFEGNYMTTNVNHTFDGNWLTTITMLSNGVNTKPGYGMLQVADLAEVTQKMAQDHPQGEVVRKGKAK
jgi:hypothetical protein